MSDKDKIERFAKLDFEAFRALARDSSLSKYERIGFPDSYRAGFEEKIFADILRKLPMLAATACTVVDIGSGSSDLARLLIAHCGERSHDLILIDSAEMLEHIPPAASFRTVAGQFPQCMPALSDVIDRVDVVLCYSVLHYVYVDTNPFEFLDGACSLLRPGGAMLIGDIPNISMRKRFFAGDAGIALHRAYTKSDEVPEVLFNVREPGRIDDSVVLGILARARASGFHAFVLPQAPDLPMANRREDILIVRP
jgi:SAM-dependent methyltransferase